MVAIDAEPKGTNGEGEPKAASVLLGVCRSAAVAGVLLVLLLTFRGVSACFSGEIDLASGSRRQIHSLNPANFPLRLLRWKELTLCSPRQSFLPAFLNLLFKSTNSLVVFLFPLLRQFPH